MHSLECYNLDVNSFELDNAESLLYVWLTTILHYVFVHSKAFIVSAAICMMMVSLLFSSHMHIHITNVGVACSNIILLVISPYAPYTALNMSNDFT